ncbi:hypothetical protein BTE77_34630 [Ensifer adhaerens]|nr:hypothetical protein BTE77_34630 [Ensifer adhaerens]
MTIKSSLLGSAAALTLVSGDHAADAIIAAEPEPMEYVRVCDAFGMGYFYVPSTETCLKIGGFVRFQTDFGRDAADNRWNGEENAVGGDADGNRIMGQSTSDWDAFSRAYISFDAKSDTEYGTLTGFFAAEFNADTDAGDSLIDVDEAYIQLGGLKAGFFYSWWDKGLNGETDSLSSNSEFSSIAYMYGGGTWQAGIAIDELEGLSTKSNGLGVEGIISANLGGVSFDLLGAYDSEYEEGAIRALLSADLGPGVFQIAGIWASDPNAYWNQSEWTIAASYRFNATDRLKLTPGVQYWGDYGFDSDADKWRVGLTADYQLTEDLATRVSLQYENTDYGHDTDKQDAIVGFVRQQRDF